jgi:hypothetical protein
MKRNNHGRVSGIALILLLLVALIVAYLAATQAGHLGFGQRSPTQVEQQNPVDQAREAVDAINGRMAQTYEAP